VVDTIPSTISATDTSCEVAPRLPESNFKDEL
jgi:hypothetical protein